MPRKPPLSMTSRLICPVSGSTTTSATLPSGWPSAPLTLRPTISRTVTSSPAAGGAMSCPDAAGASSAAPGMPGVVVVGVSCAIAAPASRVRAEARPTTLSRMIVSFRHRNGLLRSTRRHRRLFPWFATFDGEAGDLEEVRLCSRSEEHTSELQSLMHISYAVFCLKKKKKAEIQQDLED